MIWYRVIVSCPIDLRVHAKTVQKRRNSSNSLLRITRICCNFQHVFICRSYMKHNLTIAVKITVFPMLSFNLPMELEWVRFAAWEKVTQAVASEITWRHREQFSRGIPQRNSGRYPGPIDQMREEKYYMRYVSRTFSSKFSKFLEIMLCHQLLDSFANGFVCTI